MYDEKLEIKKQYGTYTEALELFDEYNIPVKDKENLSNEELAALYDKLLADFTYYRRKADECLKKEGF